MTKRKKIAAAIVGIIVMALSVVNIPDNRTEAVEGPQIIGENASGIKGDHVTMGISLMNNPGITAIVLDFTYDANVLELTGTDDMHLLEGMSMTTSQELTMNPYRVILSNGISDSDKDGELFVLHFKIKDTAEEGTYPVQISYMEDDIYNTKMENIKFDIVNPSVTVKGVEATPSEEPMPEASMEPGASEALGQTEVPIASEQATQVSEPAITVTPTGIPEGVTGESVTGESIQTDNPEDIQNKIGDVNGDDNIDLDDAQDTLKAALKIIQLDEDKMVCADVDHSGDVDLDDAQLVLKYALKIINEFPGNNIRNKTS